MIANSGKRMNNNAWVVNITCSLMIWLVIFVVNISPIVLGLSTNNVVLSNDGRLSRFKQLLDKAGISPSIAKTIIGPTTEAFEAFRLNKTVDFDRWLKYPEFFVHFKDLMEWHMVTEDNYTREEIFDGRRWQLENPQGVIIVDQKFETMDNVHSRDWVDQDILTSEGVVHVINKVMLPPFFGYDMITQLLNSRQEKFSFSNMANLALHVGLEDRINDVNNEYEKGITFLVPPNRRFNRAEIDIPKMLQKEMFNYTRDFILCHMIKDNWHVAQIFAINENTGVDQFLVRSELGTHMWITSTEEMIRFQSQEILLPDQPTPNGIFHGLDYPLFPPYITDFAFFSPISTDVDTSDCYRFFTQCQLSSDVISEMFNSTLTAFCPTRLAFAEFNNEDFNRLLSPDWYRHACEFLFNHMTLGDYTRNELVHQAPRRITMLNGQTYNLRKTGDRPRIQNGNEEGRSEFGDLIALDGYLHTIDTVITPTAVSNNIYDWIQYTPETKLFKVNIDFVDLTDYISKDTPLTVLAPDNAAFRRVEYDTIEGGPIVKRHIMRGLFFCDVLANKTEVVTVEGVVLGVEVKDDELWVGGGKVYNCDILAHNGVLHHIDRVIGLEFESPAPTQSPAPTITAVPTSSRFPSHQPVPLFAEEPDTGAVPIYLPPVEPPINKIRVDPTPAPNIESGASVTVALSSFMTTMTSMILLCYAIHT